MRALLKSIPRRRIGRRGTTLAAGLLLLVGCQSQQETAVGDAAGDAATTTDAQPAAEAVVAPSGVLPVHPHQLARLTPESTFPRFTPQQLAAAGYPDHLHAFYWKEWEVLTDEKGRRFGPGMFCDGSTLRDDAELTGSAGDLSHRNIRLVFNPDYQPCQVLPFLELLEWARIEVRDLLGFECSDTLTVYCADNRDQFGTRSGFGSWRLYKLQGNDGLVQPVPTLMGRTLVGHAAFRLMTQWTLRNEVSASLPPWLEFGLAGYLAEDGVHLNNYAAQFRSEGMVVLAPPIVDAILAGPPDQDLEKDRKYYRLARYSAFLMVWELIEHRGGLDSMRRFLHKVAAEQDMNEAARAVYGLDLDALASELDPVSRPEPIGKAIQSRSPDKAPVAAAAAGAND